MKVKFKMLDGTWFSEQEMDDYDHNKLFGWSQGWHHKNSIRVSWVPNKEVGKIDLYFYSYQNWIREIQWFTTVEMGVEYAMNINLTEDMAYFTMINPDNSFVYKEFPYTLPKAKLGYRLNFYVGGDLPARVTTKCYLEIL